MLLSWDPFVSHCLLKGLPSGMGLEPKSIVGFITTEELDLSLEAKRLVWQLRVLQWPLHPISKRGLLFL